MLNKLQKNSHCSYCGTKFQEEKLWPRQCQNCRQESYLNPIPVVVAVLPVYDQAQDRCGVLIQQRGIEPKKDQWALTGGFMNTGETWQEAIAREVMEEINLPTNPKDYQLMEILNSANSNNVLIFSFYHPITIWHKIKFTPSAEVQAIKIAFKSEPLAFLTHTQILEKYLEHHVE